MEGSPPDRRPSLEALVEQVEVSRQRFLAVLLDLDAAEARQPVGEGRWSPVEYLEHVVLAEEATLWRMFVAIEDVREGGEAIPSPTPEASIEEIVERTWRAREEAPPLAVPRLGESRAYWSERLSRNAALVRAFADLVEVSELDVVAYPHPISGPFTMRQGLEFVRFHLDRHRAHVLERAPVDARGGS